MRDVRDRLHDHLLRERPGTLDRGRMPIVEQELAYIVRDGVEGEVCEFGAHRGGMTAWLRAVLDALCAVRTVHTYDAFHDGSASADDVRCRHEQWGLRQPEIHIGWFEDTLRHELPESVALAYLSTGDYDRTLTCLRWCVPRLSPGGVVVLDGYADAEASEPGAPAAQPDSPGVLKACEDFFGTPLPLVTATCGTAGWGIGVYRLLDPVPARVLAATQ